MAEDKRPVQHTPKHLEEGRDKRHPAASAFAPLQPAAGVVADDVPPEQNPAGGPKASEAEAALAGAESAATMDAEVEAATPTPGEKRNTRR